MGKGRVNWSDGLDEEPVRVRILPRVGGVYDVLDDDGVKMRGQVERNERTDDGWRVRIRWWLKNGKTLAGIVDPLRSQFFEVGT